MRDMTDDVSVSGSALTPHHTPTLNTVPEGAAATPTTTHYGESRSCAMSRSSHHHQRALTDKRSRSSTTLTPLSSSCQLKHTSASSLVSSRSPKMRSNSVGTRPVTSLHPTRKPVVAHGDHPEQRTSTVTAQHKPRKHSSSSTKT